MKENELIRCLQILMFSCLFMVLPGMVSANGFVESSALEKAGDVFLHGKAKLILDREYVDIKLLPDSYRVTVKYEIAAPTPYDGTLYFPMICGAEAISECIEYVNVKVDSKPVPVNYNVKEQKANLLGGSYKQLARKQLAKLGYVSEDEVYDEPTEAQLVEMLTVKMISAPIVSSSKNFILEVVYKVPYLTSVGGTSKSGIYDYSHDIVYYDFSPAAFWTSNKLKLLDISIDASQLGNEPEFGSELKFKKNGNKYHVSVKNVTIKDVSALVFGIDQSKLHQYQDLQKSLAAHEERQDAGGKKTFTVFSEHEIASKDGRYSESRLVDGKFDTAWCSNKTRSYLTISLPEANSYGCFLEGIAIFNGYSKSQKLWQANNRARQIITTVSGKSKDGSTIQYEKEYTLKDLILKSEKYPYATMHIIPVQTLNIEMDGQKDYQHMDRLFGFTIRLEIMDVYKGDTYNDTCISEILPVFNCG